MTTYDATVAKRLTENLRRRFHRRLPQLGRSAADRPSDLHKGERDKRTIRARSLPTRPLITTGVRASSFSSWAT